MLDILRNAPETKYTKVIMMTALSQAEDKSRADKLGADRYLVKSQVTLEDVANVVREVLEGDQATATPAEAVPDPTPPSPPTAAPTPPPAASPSNDVLVATDPSAPLASTAIPYPATTTAASTPVTSTSAPEPVVVASSLTPVVNPVPGPTIPEIQAVRGAPQPAEQTSETLESIANPIIEVDGESDATQVQAPPANDDTTQVATSEDKDLPPLVEPPQPEAIKVELPKAPGEASEPAASVPFPVTESKPESEPEPEADFVGPSLAEALASEEDSASNTKPEDKNLNLATPDLPTVINGSSVSTVVSPTVEPPSATETSPTPIEKPSAPAPPPPAPLPDTPVTTSSGNNGADFSGKKVILPINDPTATPDIDRLLANEERNAAVANPVANTVITPEQKSQNDDLNNIAL